VAPLARGPNRRSSSFTARTKSRCQGIDRRNDQCGFDFEIAGASGTAYVEVKGIAGEAGGILLTDKETAAECGREYYLAIVRNVGTDPQVSLLPDPV
jgi:hypothetical protein